MSDTQQPTETQPGAQPDLPGVETGGPYLSLAVLCEKVLRERDGVISLIRVIDAVTHVVSAPDAPEQMPPITTDLKIVIALKAGGARGRHTVTLGLNGPEGNEIGERQSVTFAFPEGIGNEGMVLELALQFTAQEPGLYWWNVWLNTALLTRLPLLVRYAKRESSGQSTTV